MTFSMHENQTSPVAQTHTAFSPSERRRRHRNCRGRYPLPHHQPHLDFTKNQRPPNTRTRPPDPNRIPVPNEQKTTHRNPCDLFFRPQGEDPWLFSTGSLLLELDRIYQLIRAVPPHAGAPSLTPCGILRTRSTGSRTTNPDRSRA